MFLRTRSKRKPRSRRKEKLVLADATARPRWRTTNKNSQDVKVARGSSNVFVDLGFEPGDATILKIRADLMLDLRRHILNNGWTQAQAAEFFDETQPRISNLLKGEISRFSVDKLIVMLARAGITVRVETKQRAA